MNGGRYGVTGDIGLGIGGSIVGSWIFQSRGGLPRSGLVRVGRRRVLRGGDPDRGSAEGLGARLRNVTLTLQVTRSRLDLVTRHDPDEVHHRRRSV